MSIKPIFLALLGVSGLVGTAAGQETVGFGGGLQEVGATAEWLASGDINVSAYSGDWSWEGRSWSFEANATRNEYEIEYEPTILGMANDLDEKTWLFSGGITRNWDLPLSSTLSARYYDGHSDYRSIWIAEFYRQLFGLTPQYIASAPEPEGYGASLATTWNYSEFGQVELLYDFGRDIIAPGWGVEPGIGLAPGEDELNTHSGIVRVEHALAARLKAELTFGVRQTTDRDPRNWRAGYLSTSVGELGIRLGIGYAEENPEFEAFYGDVLVDWGFAPSWAAYAGSRFYRDTGEIENTGFNVLSPELDTSEVFVGLRYDTAVFAANISVGRLDSDYDEIPPTTAFLGELYRDREWWNGRASLSYKF